MTARRPRRAAGGTVPSEHDQSRIPMIELRGDFADGVTIIPGTVSTLLLSTAELSDGETQRTVLLPHIDLKVMGAMQSELTSESDFENLQPLMKVVLPLENVLWTLFDVARDVRLECETMAKVAAPGAFEQERIRLASHFARTLALEAERCADTLDRLAAPVGQSGPDPVNTPRSKT